MANFEEDLSLSGASEATEHLTLRELGSHVHVGPLPPGSVTPLTLPLKEPLAEISLFFVFLWFRFCIHTA